MKLSAPLLALTFAIGLASSAHAQLEEFVFTGTLVETSNASLFGDTISGTGTLDFAVSPSYMLNYTEPDAIGQYAEWTGERFTINVETSSGYLAGTATDGGSTFAGVADLPVYLGGSLFDAKLACFSDNGVFRKLVQIRSTDTTRIGDGIAELTEWNPLAEESTYVYIEEKNHLTQEFNYAIYTLTGFGPPNVMIDGIDTGVRDVESNGQSLSELLSELAANATSHGDFVRQVAKLTNALKKAGVITSKEKEIIMEAAAESSVGK
ncbi:MAG: hypothetical protein KDA69_00305 [Planctomycetaceae bacterium]|nr:hypothetical protein [Planctomycetaceae bacterium]